MNKDNTILFYELMARETFEAPTANPWIFGASLLLSLTAYGVGIVVYEASTTIANNIFDWGKK